MNKFSLLVQEESVMINPFTDPRGFSSQPMKLRSRIQPR